MYREITPDGITRLTGAHGTGPAGPPGAAGTPGEKWYSGAGAPAAGLGAPGDWYVNENNYNWYEKVGTVWTLRGNFKGAKGDQGIQGIQGVQGIQGIQGPIGATGATGPEGPIGPTGATGATGAKGDKGDPGPSPPIVAIHTNPGFEAPFTAGTTAGGTAVGPLPTGWSYGWCTAGVTAAQISPLTEGAAAVQMTRPANGGTARMHSNTVFSVLPNDLATFELDFQGVTVGGVLTISMISAPTQAGADYFGSGAQAQDFQIAYTTSLQRSKATFTVPAGHNFARFSFAFIPTGNVAGGLKFDNSASSVFTPPTIQDSGWIAMPFVAGWVDYGAPFQSTRYRKFQGLVYIEGLIKRTGAAVAPQVPWAVLPVGFRPPAAKVFSVVLQSGGGESYGGIFIEANGNVSVSTHTIPTNGYAHVNLPPFAAA